MALFIVRHHHNASCCPAADPYRGATLLNYLSRPNVRKHGIEIQGEAIVRGEKDPAKAEQRGREAMKGFRVEPEYFAVVSADSLSPVRSLSDCLDPPGPAPRD